MSLTGVSLVLAVVFAVCGYIFSKGKGTALLAAFIMLTPDERRTIDLPTLCRRLHKVMYYYCGGFMLMALFTLLNWSLLYWMSIAVFVYCIYLTIQAVRKAKDDV